MNSRRRINEDSTFLIYFDIDESWYVASRTHLRYDGVVTKGIACPVQWVRRPDAVDNGKVIDTGTYPEIYSKYKEIKNKEPPRNVLIRRSNDENTENIPSPSKKR